MLGEETAKKWDHSEFNIEHIIHTLFSSNEFFSFIEKLSIDQDAVLDITEDFLEETPTNESDIFTIGEDLEILLDNANQIKIQWGSRFIEIPHLLIALGRDLRIGNYVFEESNLSMEKLEEELKFFPNINQSKDSFNYENVLEINNQSNFELNRDTLVKQEKFKEVYIPFYKDFVLLNDLLESDSEILFYGSRINSFHSPRKVIFDPNQLENNNKPKYLFWIGSRRIKEEKIKLGKLIYQNNNAIRMCYRTPNKNCKEDRLRVYKIDF